MDSRSSILDKLKSSVTGSLPPALSDVSISSISSLDNFRRTLIAIGGAVVELRGEHELDTFIKDNYDQTGRIMSGIPDLGTFENVPLVIDHPRSFNDVFLLVLRGEFGVAENGAVWLTDPALRHRVLPFITENLLVVLSRTALVETMHDAYERIGDSDYDFGIFIAGPSKTADIEQSLVLGAHGPKRMTVVLM